MFETWLTELVTLDRQFIYPIYLLNNGIEAIKIKTNKTK